MPEPFSLAGRAWLPVALRSGQRQLVRLCDLSRPDIQSLDTGRSDTDTSLAEFLIGLLAVAIGPSSVDEWVELYTAPPSEETLARAFAPFAAALVLDGEGPRFFQDFDELVGQETPVEALFIDAPADHFLVEKRFEVLSRPAAAIALLTLQTMAPSGGSGHRTALRGGGGLTTLVVPRGEPTLWQSLWANVPEGLKSGPDQERKIFPWLGATRTSNPKDHGVETTSQDCALAQMFFGMPRRIRLTFEANTDHRSCDLLGDLLEDDVLVRSYVTRPWGVNYPSHTWRHQLSPYYKQKTGEPQMLPLHLKSSRVGYRQWLELVSTADDETEPAKVVKLFRDQRARRLKERPDSLRIKAAGYALDNMKPLDFAEATLPLFTAGSEEANQKLDARARSFVEAAEIAANQLVSSVWRALHGDKVKIERAATTLMSVSTEFWTDTEAPFYQVLKEIADAIAAGVRGSEITTKHGNAWLTTLRRSALDIFDARAHLDALDPERIRDVIEARKQLSLMFKCIGKSGEKLYAALGLGRPEKPPKDGPQPPRGRKGS